MTYIYIYLNNLFEYLQIHIHPIKCFTVLLFKIHLIIIIIFSVKKLINLLFILQNLYENLFEIVYLVFIIFNI